jgi:regulator of nucleoside diphosphate kinase
MKYGNLIVDKDEYNSLMRSISISTNNGDKTYKTSLNKLSAELKMAKIVKNSNMPDDIIRFNSFVTICTSFNVERCYQIVAPEKSDIHQNKISILSPMALALFGYAKNDEISWEFPSGMSTIKIIDVVQKEEVFYKLD